MSSYMISAHDVQYTIQAEEGSLIGQRIAASGQPYEPALLEHIYQSRFTGTAIDVGACIGNHTLWFALVCKLPVVAFEPIDIEELEHNLALNSGNPAIRDVRVEPVALGAEAGWARDSGKRVLTAVTTRAEREDATAAEGQLLVGEGPVTVELLDSYDLHDVALIKIDVEGMEPDVLLGGAETINREQPVIFAEAKDGDAHRKLEDVLAPWGYEQTARFKRGTPVERWDPK